eukprot:Selendium_serpulae@DN3455_c0_g1_i4.p1
MNYENHIAPTFKVMKQLGLNIWEVIRVRAVELPRGQYLRLRPHDIAYLEGKQSDDGEAQTPVPRAALTHSLKHFTALTEGDTITVRHSNKEFEVEVVGCRPSKAVLILGTELTVEYERPREVAANATTAEE